MTTSGAELTCAVPPFLSLTPMAHIYDSTKNRFGYNLGHTYGLTGHAYHKTPAPEQENIYFRRSLNTMSGIIRNSGFSWYYPPFQPRLWILYEIAESDLTADGETGTTPDNEEFKAHIKEMVDVGVRPTLDKHGYSCSYDGDKEFLTSWLELLVLLTRLCVDIGDIRRILDGITWHHPRTMLFKTLTNLITLCPYEGTLEFFGKRHTFTPLPEDDKYSWSATSGLEY
ncbi:hypothetical protein CIB48_g8 [Xylaria polymorpha]|nr:hypothetical protein CIB48_g8 [Xylaria polymorpha]